MRSLLGMMSSKKQTSNKVRLEIPSIQALYRGNLTEYYKILLTSSIACDIVYKDDPMKVLQKVYHPFTHDINQMIVSGCSDDKKHEIPLDVKYMICQDDEARRIYVVFRGTRSVRDLIDDANFMIDDTRGQFHSGFYKRAHSIPIEYFKRRALEKYQIILTGHSLGGAVAAIVTARLLAEEGLSPETLNRFLCVTFASPLIANDEFGSFINKNHQDKFHFFVLEDDPVPVILSILSDLIHDGTLLKNNDFKLEWTKILGSTASDSLSSFFPGLLNSLTPFMNNLQLNIPKYTGFGHYIHIHDTISENKELSATLESKGNELKVRIFTEKAHTEIYAYGREKFAVSADALATLQKHRMTRYIAELHNLFSIYYTDYRTRPGFFERYRIFKFLWKKKNECKYLDSPELNIPDNLAEKSNLSIVVNGMGCRVILSFSCLSAPYILAVKMQLGYITYEGVLDSIEESGNVSFVFNCPSTLLLESLSYMSEKTLFEIIGHFNTVKIELTLPDIPEDGLSSRTIKELSKSISEKFDAKGEELMNTLKDLSRKDNFTFMPQQIIAKSVICHRTAIDALPNIHRIREKLSERFVLKNKRLVNGSMLTAGVMGQCMPSKSLGVWAGLLAAGVTSIGKFNAPFRKICTTFARVNK